MHWIYTNTSAAAGPSPAKLYSESLSLDSHLRWAWLPGLASGLALPPQKKAMSFVHAQTSTSEADLAQHLPWLQENFLSCTKTLLLVYRLCIRLTFPHMLSRHAIYSNSDKRSILPIAQIARLQSFVIAQVPFVIQAVHCLVLQQQIHLRLFNIVARQQPIVTIGPGKSWARHAEYHVRAWAVLHIADQKLGSYRKLGTQPAIDGKERNLKGFWVNASWNPELSWPSSDPFR